MDLAPPPPAGVLTYAGPQPSRRGKGFLGAAASHAVAGLGQWLAGRRRRAVGWFVTIYALQSVLLLLIGARGRILWLLPVLTAITILAILACLIDAYRTARRSPSPMLGRPGPRYLAGIVILAAAYILNPAHRIAIAVRDHWAEAFSMPTATMSPTINPGDRFIASKVGRTWHRWDLVVFRPPPSNGARLPLVKRVAGLPGETVEIINGVVHINGAAVPAPFGIGPYVYRTPMPETYGSEGHPVTLGPDEYYVLGDNAPISADSRVWREPVRGNDIIGHVTFRYWPIARWKVFE